MRLNCCLDKFAYYNIYILKLDNREEQHVKYWHVWSRKEKKDNIRKDDFSIRSRRGFPLVSLPRRGKVTYILRLNEEHNSFKTFSTWIFVRAIRGTGRKIYIVWNVVSERWNINSDRKSQYARARDRVISAVLCPDILEISTRDARDALWNTTVMASRIFPHQERRWLLSPL